MSPLCNHFPKSNSYPGFCIVLPLRYDEIGMVVDTVYIRVSDNGDAETQDFKANTINIAYRFTLPSQEISSIVDHMGMGSSQPPT